MSIRITQKALGSNTIGNVPAEIKRYSVQTTKSAEEADSSVTSVLDRDVSSTESVDETSVERRTRRAAEYREAANIRDRALEMKRQAENQLKETSEFKTLMNQAKEDPTILAKALGMDSSEFQRKMFNKMYSIKEEAVPEKEENFEEQTKRRLSEYEQERAQEKDRQLQQMAEQRLQKDVADKNNYVKNKIIPSINEGHEFIINNGTEYCANLIYDSMNAMYKAEVEKAYQQGRQYNPDDFQLQAIDVIDQMEEELYKRSEEQMIKARSVKKLSKYFTYDGRSSDEEYIPRKRFGDNYNSDSSPRKAQTLTNSFSSSSPSVSNNSGNPNSSRHISLKNKEARREQTKRNLGS